MKTKIILGVSIAVAAAAGIFFWQWQRQLILTGEERERVRQLNLKIEASEKIEKQALARADSFQVLHKTLAETAQRREVYMDSMIAELDRFGKKIVFVRQYENDSIVGSIDLSRQHKLFTEWLAAAKESNDN